MKIIAMNGSPRKGWNTEQLLKRALEGAASAGAETELIQLYAQEFKGCISCFACKRKGGKTHGLCAIRDSLTPILQKCREADALLIGSPVYYDYPTAQTRAFLERLMYPGKTAKVIPTYFILSMNAPEDAFKEVIQPQIGMTFRYVQSNFGISPKQFCSYDTWQRDHEERYKKSSHDMAAKKIRHDVQFPVDLQNAYEAGAAFVADL